MENSANFNYSFEKWNLSKMMGDTAGVVQN